MTTRREKKGSRAGSGRATPGAEASPSWRYRIGRVLQFVGLLVLPFGIASELVGRVGLGQSLLVAGGGALVFYVGYVIQHGEGDNRDVGG